MKTKYLVYGWYNCTDYDAGRPADCVIAVWAGCPSLAEDIGDKQIEKEFGRCDVIDSEPVE
jgi:hypothetical protein